MHPAFVWEKVDEYPKLDKRTVTVDTAISRLRTIAAVDISADDERILKSLRMTRNAIEHYEWSTTEREAKTIIGNAISFALTFSAEHLETDLERDFKRDDTWRELLRELSEFRHAHGKRIAARYEREGKYTIYCDECEGDWCRRMEEVASFAGIGRRRIALSRMILNRALTSLASSPPLVG